MRHGVGFRVLSFGQRGTRDPAVEIGVFLGSSEHGCHPHSSSRLGRLRRPPGTARCAGWFRPLDRVERHTGRGEAVVGCIDAPGHSFDPRRDLSWRQARPGVLSRICDLLDEAGTPATELEVLRLSGCGPSYSAADRRRLGDLRGSDLVFLDPDAAAKFGDAELASFAELGINRLIFSAFDSESEIEEVRFSSRSANRRSNARRIASETFPGARKSRRRVDSSRRMGELVDRLSASAHVGPGYTLEHGDRIVLVTYALPPGGAERQWVYLARGLKQAGYDVALVTYVELTGDNAHYLPWLEKSQIPVFPVVHRPPITLAEWLASDSAFRRCVAGKMAPYPEIILGLVETFRRLRPKAVIGQLDYPNLFSGLAALLAGVPRAVMYIPTRCGNFYEDWYRPAYAVLSRSPRILLSGICADANREYADWIGVARDRVACIPNAIDPEDFPACDADAVEALRAELCLEPGQPVILGVFRLSKEKNPAAFVEVCSRLVASAFASASGIGGGARSVGQFPFRRPQERHQCADDPRGFVVADVRRGGSGKRYRRSPADGPSGCCYRCRASRRRDVPGSDRTALSDWRYQCLARRLPGLAA
jgi:hypothetical protein